MKTQAHILEKLVASGAIASYRFTNIDEDGLKGEKSAKRNSERLNLLFPNGEKLTIDCFCSPHQDTFLYLNS